MFYLTKMSKRIIATFSVLLMIAIVLVMSVSAEGDLNDQFEPQYTMRYISVTEYDFVTDTERTYQMSYRVYDLMSDVPEYELNGETDLVSPMSVIPDDEYEWERVPSSLYSTYPYSAICSMYAGSRSTAFIVGDRIALTSAHCVYAENAWDTEAYILPHASGNRTHSYIMNNGVRALKAIIPTVYKTNAITGNDWAILILEEDVGAANGILPLDIAAPTVGNQVTTIGYPKEGVGGVVRYMHESPGEILTVGTNYIRYNCDTSKGNSGGPVIKESVVNGTVRYNVIAIHSSGHGSYNEGCRIDLALSSIVKALDVEYD